MRLDLKPVNKTKNGGTMEEEQKERFEQGSK